MDEVQFKNAHEHSWKHKAEIESSVSCACFFCLSNFPPSDISEWIDGGTTAMCPRCGIDSVIGDASGLPILEASFMNEMANHFFGGPVDLPEA